MYQTTEWKKRTSHRNRAGGSGADVGDWKSWVVGRETAGGMGPLDPSGENEGLTGLHGVGSKDERS